MMTLRSLLPLRRVLAAAFATASLVAASTGPGIAQSNPGPLNAVQGSFSVGGQYANIRDVGTVLDGGMYVQFWRPNTVTHPFPLVLIHGGVGTGGTWTSTPDGREGWAQFFVRQGFVVYVVDQPARGRAPYNANLDGPIGNFTVLASEQLFTATELFNLWPQAHLHTQWPSNAPNKGTQGDPIFDNYMRLASNALSNGTEADLLNRAAGGALLDRIGPAIVLGRSQSGYYPFLYADVRPGMVKGMIDIEGGAPALNCYICNLSGVTPTNLTPSWGIVNTPITYSPAVTSPAQLVKVVNSAPAGPDLATCWKQGAPVHTLPTLAGIPTMVMAAESSFAIQTQICTSQYLTQAGVPNTYADLGANGIHGNGHLMNSERNSEQVAQFLLKWLHDKGL